jgi:hypothetical protein
MKKKKKYVEQKVDFDADFLKDPHSDKNECQGLFGWLLLKCRFARYNEL